MAVPYNFSKKVANTYKILSPPVGARGWIEKFSDLNNPVPGFEGNNIFGPMFLCMWKIMIAWAWGFVADGL
ncbi:MAG TPA: hypothetical protein DCZ08_11450 [Anaerolineaceae bacterium]|nr:hypothetical protein [Anaerolineaceae bacterium]